MVHKKQQKDIHVAQNTMYFVLSKQISMNNPRILEGVIKAFALDLVKYEVNEVNKLLGVREQPYEGYNRCKKCENSHRYYLSSRRDILLILNLRNKYQLGFSTHAGLKMLNMLLQNTIKNIVEMPGKKRNSVCWCYYFGTKILVYSY